MILSIPQNIEMGFYNTTFYNGISFSIAADLMVEKLCRGMLKSCSEY